MEEKFPLHTIVEQDVMSGDIISMLNETGTAFDIWSHLSSRIHNLSSISAEEIAALNTSSALQELVPQLSPEQLHSLVEEVADVVNDISYKHFKTSIA